MSGEVVGLWGSGGSLGVTKLSIPANGFRPRRRNGLWCSRALGFGISCSFDLIEQALHISILHVSVWRTFCSLFSIPGSL